MAKLSENEMMEHIISTPKEKKETVNNASVNDTDDSKKRTVIIVGAGDGGGNIASSIKERTLLQTAIYNTSSRNILSRLHFDDFIHPGKEDGSGKERKYSKDVFKNGTHEQLRDVIVGYKTSRWNYNIVTTTTDGGTGGGASPNIAKYLEAVTKNTTMIIGVYPSINEDARSQYNTLGWQADVNKIELPYMVYDNSRQQKPMLETHAEVNKEIADAMYVFSGQAYSESETLDNRDFDKIIGHGGRVNIYTSTARVKVNETLDDYIETMITKSYQPEPDNVKAYALYVKGPADFIGNLDLTLQDTIAKYGGFSKDIHVEESKDVRISLITTGSVEPGDRLSQIRKRYDDIMSGLENRGSIIDSLMIDMEDPTTNKAKSVIDPTAALDI